MRNDITHQMQMTDTNRIGNSKIADKFTLLLGSDINMLSFSAPNSGLLVIIKIKSDVDFAILINELPICMFDRDEILYSRPIDMDQDSIRDVKNKLDAVNKVYADRIKC